MNPTRYDEEVSRLTNATGYRELMPGERVRKHDEQADGYGGMERAHPAFVGHQIKNNEVLPFRRRR